MTNTKGIDMTKVNVKRKTKRKSSKGRKIKKISHLRKPEDLPLEQWQIALRKQFAQKQNFRLKNIGEEPIFSEFTVTNPETGGEYRVAIRGQRIGDNYCSCPDFAVNTLGTCKHIEFTLAKLQRKRGGKKAFVDGFQPAYSEIYLRSECPKSLLELASRYFDKYGILKSQGYSRFDTFMRKAGAIKHDLRCYEDTIEFIAQVRDQALLKKRIEKAFPSGANSAAFRKLLKAQLYPYQREGSGDCGS